MEIFSIYISKRIRATDHNKQNTNPESKIEKKLTFLLRNTLTVAIKKKRIIIFVKMFVWESKKWLLIKKSILLIFVISLNCLIILNRVGDIIFHEKIVIKSNNTRKIVIIA